MSDILIYTTLASSILVILFIIGLLRGRRSAGDDESENDSRPQVVRREPAAAPRRVGGRTVRGPRLARARAIPEDLCEEEVADILGSEDVDEIVDDQNIVLPDDGKIGAKKRKKLQEKAEKRAQREQELQEREERKKRQVLLDEQRKKDEESEHLEETKRLEEEKRLKEEEKQREHEEYLKLKESFQVESEGFDDNVTDKEAQDLLKEFIEFVKCKKVVLLEDLAVKFKLKTQDAIERINSLMCSGELTGVIDDRGKFIYISHDEMAAVAKFIRQRGRVSISDLVESSNMLINMNPERNAE